MTDTKGTEKTMNVINLVFAVAEAVAKEVSGDGLQWSDIPKIFAGPSLQDAIAAAASSFAGLPGKIKDLTTLEGIDVTTHVLDGTKRVVLALRKAA